MKKTYFSPAVNKYAVVTESMVAQSLGISGDKVDTKDPNTPQLSKEQSGDWDNIWK